MDNASENPGQDRSELDSLEGSTTVVEPDQSADQPTNNSAPEPGTPSDNGVAPAPEPGSTGSGNAPTPTPPKPPFWIRFVRMFRRFNVYLLLFILIIVVTLVVLAIAYVHNRTGTGSISNQTLSENALQQLASNSATVGDSNQVLNIQSNAVFAGQVLVRSNLQVAGTLQVGGSLSLTGITVSGTSSFDQVQIGKDLSVTGNTALQGALTVQKSLNVTGDGSFNGSLTAGKITASSLQLNGDLTLTHHITFGGAIPGKSNGSALGAGGTASVSGSDSAGSITISTGSSPSAGCFITVNFSQKFNATPHVLVTPVGSAAGGLGYYVNRSTSNFSVCSTTAAAGGQTFGFDYLVLD